MWSSQLFFCFLLGGVVLARHEQQREEQPHAWKSGSEYKYHVQGRTLAALHQVANQYSGMLMKAELIVQPKSAGTLRARISQPWYAQIHTDLPGGWDSDIPENKLSYKNLPMSGKPFEIKLKNGAIDDLLVEQNTPNWEVNVLKSIASQLQVDAQGENLMKSKSNQGPEGGQASAAYKTMEDSVTGKCEVNYDISPLPDYILQTRPELAPLPQLRGDGQMIDVVKSKNFSHCRQPSTQYDGLSGFNDEEPGANNQGVVSRSSVSRIILSGSIDRHTIQSSVTTNRVVMSPTLHENQKGMVVSRLNLTLAQVVSLSGSKSISSPSNPKSTGNLVYRYSNDWSQNEDDDDDSSDSSSSSSDSSSSSNSDSSSSSSSSSEEDQRWRNHRRSARQIMDNEENDDDNVNQSQEIARQIGNELQDPSSIPEKHTLEKFDILVGLIGKMNTEQIDQAQQSLYQPADKTNPNSQSDSSRRSAWVAYRDAVAAAGTVPALLNIKQWIQQRKIQGVEAAAIVASLPEINRNPSAQYLDIFFTMATSSEVSRQAYLNSSAILAVTDLAHMAQRHNDKAHNRYPVHGLAGQSPKDHSAVIEKHIPYLSRQLKSAIRDADSPKILVYIRALGNLGHPKILSVFEPYLEGEKDASDFQRLTMVVGMDRLCELYPRLAQSVLFKIYRNAGETSEVRSAAVFKLMRTNPPASMLQRMAHFTHWDLNNQVNSAVKTAIESAAELENDDQLSSNARAARDMLSTKSHGFQWTQEHLKDYDVGDMNLAYQLSILTIGNEDSSLPDGIYAGLRRYYGSKKPSLLEMGALVSSMDQLTSIIAGQIESDDGKDNWNAKSKKGSGKWTPEKIAKLLNIQSQDSEQLEGQLMWNTDSAKYFFAFDNHTIDQIPNAIRSVAQALKNGQSFNATKFGDKTLQWSFPTEMGFPFFYSLMMPSLFEIGGEAKIQSNPDLAAGSPDQWKIPSTIKATADLHIVYSTQMQSRIGFVTPFDNQKYLAGVRKNFHLNLPLRFCFDLDAENQNVRVKVHPIEEDRDYNLVHYSNKPYTAKADYRSTSPLSLDKNMQTINTGKATKNEFSFGEKATGMVFRLKTLSEANSWQDIWASVQELFASHDSISAFAFSWAQASIEENSYDLVFDSARSSSKAVVVNASWDSQRYEGGKKRGDSGAGNSWQFSQNADAQEYQKRIRGEAATGEDDLVHSVDVGVQFEGPGKAEYTASAAWASSNTEEKSRVVFYYQENPAAQKPFEVYLRADAETPNAPELNFDEALKADSTSKIDLLVRFGEQCAQGCSEVRVEAEMRQSSELKNHLRQQPLAKQCAKQMEQGDNALPACRTMIARANQLDEARVTIKHKDVSASAAEMAATAYRYAHSMTYPNAYVNMIDPKDQEADRIDMNFKWSKDMENLNASVNLLGIDIAVIDVQNGWNWPWMVEDEDDSPVCVLDNNSASTFDNETYSVELGNCWHVVFTTIPQEDPDNENEDLDIPEDMRVTVIAREVSKDQKEVKITLGQDEINFTPTQSKPQVQVNGQNLRLSQDESYTQMDDEDDEAIFEIYELPDGSVKLSSHQFGMDAVYDGSRVKISAAQKYRGSSRGLCGTLNGQPADDFTTPQNCILSKPEEFAASYALTGQQCDGPAKQRAQKAQQSHCVNKENSFGNVISNQEAGRQRPAHSTWGNSEQNKNQGPFKGNCHTHKTKVVRENGQTCVSLKPVPACNSRCHSVEKKEKNVEFHCVADGQAASALHKHIRNDGNPDFIRKEVLRSIKIAVPTSCAA